jgi:hypothetical protein
MAMFKPQYQAFFVPWRLGVRLGSLRRANIEDDPTPSRQAAKAQRTQKQGRQAGLIQFVCVRCPADFIFARLVPHQCVN